jgi:hypothetical protein
LDWQSLDQVKKQAIFMQLDDFFCSSNVVAIDENPGDGYYRLPNERFKFLPKSSMH